MNEEEFKRKYLDYPLKVYDIFKEYYGEDKVDIQGLPDYSKETLDESSLNIFILVYFPEVRVTNEYDRSTVIKDLYVKIKITKEGKLVERFTFNRAKYTVQEWESNYMHSHSRTIYKTNPDIFSTVCTGTGPINNTMSSLKFNYNEDLWRLFCLELDRFTQVESLEGTPYNRLENIGVMSYNVRLKFSSNSLDLFDNLNDVSWINVKSFIEYLINSNVFTFSYYNNSYHLGMSEKDYIIKVSNAFITWYNLNKYYEKYNLSTLLEKGVLIRAYLSHKGELKTGTNCYDSMNTIMTAQGAKVCTFKGKDITLSIVYSNSDNDNTILILNCTFLGNLLMSILNLVNFNYGK